ncbi:MAG: hypothetical protein ABI237_14295 [Ginsengibacter sp.]
MKKLLNILIFFILPAQVFSQSTTLKGIENDLQRSYREISGHGYPSTNDSVEIYDSLFRIEIAYYISHFPKTLTYKFDSLTSKTDISIATSKDNLFRIYSWDRYDGGTMHNFDNLFQFQSGAKVYSKLSADTGTDQNYDPGVYYTTIYTLRITKNKTYYLAMGTGIYSTMARGTRIKIFTVENHLLNDNVKLIRTKKGKRVNSIDSYYNMGFNYPKDQLPNDVTYNSIKRTLYIPVVDRGTDSVTNHSDIYQFNGEYFKYTNTQNVSK